MADARLATQRRQRRFLQHLADTGNVSAACRLAKLERGTAYQWRSQDANFRRRWQEALDAAVDALESEARRRAIEGVDQPHFHQGQVTGTVKRYSDALLMFLLRTHRPDRFAERANPAPHLAEETANDQDAARAELERRLDRLAAGDDPADDAGRAE